MATFNGNTVEAPSGSGGPIFVFDTITALAADCPATKIVFGNDAEISASWSFNTGALDDGTPRVTLATNDPAIAALEAIESYIDTEVAALLTGVQLLDDAVETNRFAVNTIAGAVGVQGGSGVITATTQRVVVATDDVLLTAMYSALLSIQGSATSMDVTLGGWDESGRAKVDLIVGQLGIAAGAGVVSVSTPRVTLASDDPAVALLTTIDVDTGSILTALQIIDDWDESDRAKVNLIVGQAGISAGAGAVGLNTPRITHASDDPVTAALQIIDDWDESDRAKVNLIAGQAGVTAGAGVVAVNTPRVTLASDDPAVALLTTIDADTSGIATSASAAATSLAILDDWDETDRAKVNLIVGQAGVAGNVGAATDNTIRVAIASSGIGQTVQTHDSPVAINVVQFGLEARNTEPTAVGTTGDATRAMGTMLGKQIVVPYAIPASTWQYASVSGGITDTADDVAKASAGAGVRNYITHCSVINASSSVSTEVVIKDGTTVIWRGWAQANGGGVSEKFDPPLRGTAATAVNVTNITTGAQTYFNLQGYIAAE